MKKMKKLKLKPNIKEEEALKNPSSLGRVYICPKCKVGDALTQISSDRIKCNLCNGEYLKP